MKIYHKKKESQVDKLLFGSGQTKGDDRWISIPFLEGTSKKVKHIIEKGTNRKVTFSNSRNLGGILINTKDQEDPFDASGVYKISCSCNKQYVGQTGRKVTTRIKEHLRGVSLEEKGKSSFADHIIDTSHNIEECTVEVVKNCKKGKKLNVLEQLEIDKVPPDKILNSQVEQQIAPVVIPEILLRSADRLGKNIRDLSTFRSATRRRAPRM